MSSALTSSVRTQLTLAILTALFLSYLLGTATTYYLFRQDQRAFRQAVLSRHPEAARSLPPEPGGGFWGFVIGPFTPPARPAPTAADGRGRERPPRVERRYARLAAVLRIVIAFLLALATGALLGRRFTRPLSALAQGARAYHRGRFDHRITVRGHDEFSEVADTMNDMADRVAEQLRDLEADAHRRRQLLADVAHELRGPVTTLHTMAGALHEGLAASPERRERATELMAQATERLLHLVNDLLELTRLDLHELPIHPQRVDARELVEVVARAHGEAAAEAGMTLSVRVPDEPVHLTLDPNRFAQVLDNLLDNAVSYAGAGAEVRIILERSEAEARVVVEDTGRGIPSEHLPYLFDTFYRVDAARSPGDNHSGLGLRIARGLVQAQGGTLTLESEAGAGTRATIAFPLTAPAA